MVVGGKKSSTALIKKISLSTVLTAFDDLKNGFLSFAVLEGRLRGAGLCGLSSKSMFKLDVSTITCHETSSPNRHDRSRYLRA